MKKELQGAIKQIASIPSEIYSTSATVMEIDKTANTCTCSPLDGSPEIYDVKLQSVENGTQGILIIPKLKSVVTIDFMDMAAAHITATSDIDSYKISIGNNQLLIDKDNVQIKSNLSEISLSQDKIKIQRNDIDLGTVLSQLLDAMSILTVTCTAPGTPSTPPVNVLQFQQIKAQLSMIL